MTKTKVIKIPKQKGFAEVAFVWLKEHRQLADVDFTHNAYYRKERFVYIFMNFLMERFKNYSIPFEEINEKLLNELYLYSRTELNFSIPYYRKMVQTIKQVVNYAVINDLTTKSYIFNYKIKSFAKKQILYITLAQIKELQEAEIHNEKLSRTRDFFLFQCYTGVAYIDMKTFKLSNLITDAFQNEWIVIHRQKTGGKSTIPLMPEAKAIIEKYRNVTKTVNPGGFFPIQNNKDYNDTLKKLENYSSIPREKLHSHCGRKTFAMTVLNSGNVSIETVSKMLGHAKIDMTQKHYAFVDTKKIRNEMEKFSFTPKEQ
ncbi:MAG: tyrosine-type recombinase/integrase [Bacteroidetes bacterium]|nr:tyrosine-type recombinase/integrase [Bacteroidota bacterium]